MVRAAQKGERENPSSEVAQAASSMSKSDVKKFAKTKHDKLPEKVVSKEAYYGGEEQRKKDQKKAAYEKQLKRMLPKRAFDQMGREIDPRSGKLKEGVGLEVARAIDKTKPPLGRPSVRRKVSDALKMREVNKSSKKKRTFKHADSPGKKSFKDFTKEVETAKNRK